MEHCVVEEQTILVYFGCYINRNNIGIIEYDTFWNDFDFSAIPPSSLIHVARNISKITASRRRLYESNRNLEENSILWETFAFAAVKVTKVFDDLYRDRSKDTEESFKCWIETKLGPQYTQYKQTLHELLAGFQDSELSVLLQEEIVLLREHCQQYDKSFTDFVWGNVRAIVDFFSNQIREQLEEAKYTPLDIGSTGKLLENFFGKLSVQEVSESRAENTATEEDWYFPTLIYGSNIDFGLSPSDVRSGIILDIKGDGCLDIVQSDGHIINNTRPSFVKLKQGNNATIQTGGGKVKGKGIHYGASLKRMSSDIVNGFKGSSWGLIEQDILLCDMGIDVEVNIEGYYVGTKGAKDYGKLWSEKLNYSALPKTKLDSIITKMEQVVAKRIQDKKNYKNPDPNHELILECIQTGLAKAKQAQKYADNAPTKILALNAKKLETLAKRKERAKTGTKKSEKFKEFTEKLEKSIASPSFGIQSTQLSRLNPATMYGGSNRPSNGTRAKSSYDYFRSEVWTKGSGTRSAMLNAYYDWEGVQPDPSYSLKSSSTAGVFASSGGSGGGYSFNLSNVVIV